MRLVEAVASVAQVQVVHEAVIGNAEGGYERRRADKDARRGGDDGVRRERDELRVQVTALMAESTGSVESSQRSMARARIMEMDVVSGGVWRKGRLHPTGTILSRWSFPGRRPVPLDAVISP